MPTPTAAGAYPRPRAADLPLPGSDRAEIRRHLEHADPRIVLMSLIHLTRDEQLLEELAPAAAPTTGEAEKTDLAARARDLLAEALTRPASPDADQPLPDPLFQRMASVCVGETVDPEFLPLLREQGGFSAREAVPAEVRATPPNGFHVVIIGAGLSGMCAAIKLAEAGYGYRVYDRNADVGGTWLANRYPGVGVDTPSHFYSFSFEINPDWPEYYSNGRVVWDYLRTCADAHGLRENTTFDTEVTGAHYDETTRRWTVTSRGPDGVEHTETADAVISAIGFFQAPMHPTFPGLDRFTGPVVHIAAWDPDVDLTGKRVALIGTGAGAMQVGPAIVDRVRELTVFQRQPSWIMPRRADSLVVPAGARWAMRHVPFHAEWFRTLTYWITADGNYPRVVVDPHWTMTESVSKANEDARQWLLAYAREELDGRPDLLEKAVPTYPPFGKRILRDCDWYRMLRRDHVRLETSAITHATAEGLATAGGESVDVDVVVLATGYHLLPMLDGIDITGRGGITLRDVWGEEDPRALRGVTVPGFPNFFVIGGPNSGANHGAGVNIITETQVNYILGCLGLMHARGATAIEPTEQAHDTYNETVDRALDGLVWSHPTVRGYYRNSSGRVIVSNPWRLVDYWWMTRAPQEDEYLLT
ncbi:flavin-containing monooxygenase [Embleya sp. NPDC050493]|uniref:flavin-containing monooxygenase n=1 Tax=Embleya sp. NPDC050493 TaxID=3363989 RepID=UPI0037AFD543